MCLKFQRDYLHRIKRLMRCLLNEMVLAVADGSLEYEDMLKWVLEHQE